MKNTDFIWIKGNHDKNIQIEGFKNFHTDTKSAPMTRGELEDLMERYPD